MLLGLEREGVRVDTGVWGAAVVLHGLHLVEVLAGLLLEAVLTVKHKLEGLEWANGVGGRGITLLSPAGSGTKVHTGGDQLGGTVEGGAGHAGVASARGVKVGCQHNGVGGTSVGCEVPHVSVGGSAVVEGPHQLLHWVVVGQAHLLGGANIHGVGTGVLHLLDEVLVTLLGEAAALLGIEVHVVGPHLEAGGLEVAVEAGCEVDVQTHLVVLQGNQWQVQARVAVEEEDEWEEHLGVSGTVGAGGHLTPVGLLGLVEVELGVQAPPHLVVLVDTLATDGQLNVLNGALGHPAWVHSAEVTSEAGEGLCGHLDVHVTHEVTVAGDGHRHATVVGNRAVQGLLDVLHGEVGVTLVHRLEEGYLGGTGKEYVLSAISYKLHKTACHCCCTIRRENISDQPRAEKVDKIFHIQ